MTTVFCENGELNAFVADGHLVLDAFEEILVGRDRVCGRKLTLQLTPHDAARLRRVLGSPLRENPPASASGPKLALSVRAKEAAI